MGRTKVATAPWTWIREARANAGLSQNEAARKLDVSENGYRAWERHGARWSRPTMEHLAAFCEITGADFREAVRVVYGLMIPGYANSTSGLGSRVASIMTLPMVSPLIVRPSTGRLLAAA